MDETRKTELEKQIEECKRRISMQSAAHFALGMTLLQQGKNEEAMAEYKKAAQIDSTNDGALLQLGLMLRNLGRYEEALENFSKVIELDNPYDSDCQAYYYAGLCLEALGSELKAGKLYKQCVERHCRG